MKICLYSKVGVGRRGHVWRDIEIHVLAQVFFDTLVFYGLVDFAISCEETGKRQHQVCGIYISKFHIFVLSDIVSELYTYSLPGRTTGSEIVLLYPLHKILTENRNPVALPVYFSNLAISSSVVAGVIRSTIVLGKVTLARAQ